MLSLRFISRKFLLAFTGLFVIFAASLMFLIWPAETAGVAYVWDGGGSTSNWSENANWSPDGQPGSADTVTFNGTSTKNSSVDAAWAGTVSSITIASGYTGTLSLARSLTVNTTFSQAAGTFTGNSQAMLVKTNFTLSGGTFNNTTETATGGLRIERNFTQSGGTFNGTSTMISFIDDGSSDNSVFTCASTFNATNGANPRVVVTKDQASSVNNFTVSKGAADCTLYSDSFATVAAVGTVTVNAGANLHTLGSFSVFALTVNALGTFSTNQTTATFDDNVTISGTLAIPASTTLNFEGNLNLSSAATTNIPNWATATVNFIDDGGGDDSTFTCSGAANSSGNSAPVINVVKDLSSGVNGFTVSTGSTCTIHFGNTGSFTSSTGNAGTVTINSGVTAALTGSLSLHSLVVSGTLSQTGTTVALSGNLTVNNGGVFSPPASTSYDLQQDFTYAATATISNWSTASIVFSDNGTGDASVFTCNGTVNGVGNASPTITFAKDHATSLNGMTVTAGTSGSCTVYLTDFANSSLGSITVGTGARVVTTGNIGTLGAMTVNGTLTAEDTSIAVATSLTLGGTLNLAPSTTITIDRNFNCTGGTLGTNFATSTLIFASDTNADDTTYTCTGQVGNISIQKDVVGALFTQADNISVGGNFSASLLSAYVSNATYYDLSVSGSVTLTANASTAWAFNLVANGTSTSSTYTNASGAEIAGEFRLEGGAITKKLILASGLAPVGSCTLTRGTLSRNGQNFTCPNAIQTLLTADSNVVYEVIGTEVETGTWPHVYGEALIRFIGDGDGAADSYTLSGSGSYGPWFPYLEIAAIDASDTFTGGMIIEKGFTMTSGILNANTGNTTFKGATWTKTGGTYTAGTGTVSFDGSTQATVVGDTTFSNLRLNYSSVASKTVLFTAGSTTTVTGTLEGPSSGSYLLTLGSTSNGSAWNINASGSPSLIRTIVRDSNAADGSRIDCLTSCTNNGNNTNWRFTTAGITVGAISGNTTEAGGTATFTVVLDGTPSADVTIGLTSSDTTEGTVSPSSLTFTTGNWSTPQTVTITGVNDDVDDGNVAYSIVTAAATSSDGSYNNLNASDVSVTNTDNDTAAVTVSAISDNTTETGGTGTFTVVLATQPTADVLIGVSSNDTSEGTVSPSSLTFTSVNWATPQTVTVTGVDDDLDDGDVAYSIVTAAASSSDGNYNTLNPADISVTNTDNDNSGVTVSTISGSTTEAGGTATFTVFLTAQPTADVSIGLTSDDTSEGTVSPSSLTFTSVNWATPQTVTVTGVNDDLDDGDINYSIITAAASSADSNYNTLNPDNVSVTNTDNDPVAGVTVSTISENTTEDGGTATFTVVLTAQPTADVSTGITSNDTSEGTVSPSSVTFTTSNWNTPQTVTVTGVNDDLDDGDISYSIVTAAASSSDGNYNNLNPSDVSVTNTDNDTSGFTVSAISGNTTEAGGTATFTVALTAQPTADVSTGITSNDTSEGTVSPSSLTFTSINWATPQTITVTGVNDDLDDGDIAYSIVTAAASSGDSNYNSLNPADASVTNTDNDTSGFTVSAISGNTYETGGSSTFTVVLTAQPTASVAIGITSSDTSEGTVSPSSLTFTTGNWATPQTVSVFGVDDLLADGDVAYSIVTAAASSSDNNYNGLNPADVSVTNINNDTASIFILDGPGSVSESGSTDVLRVGLNTQPSADVTINFSSSDTSEGTVSPSSLTFTTANWLTTQNLTLTGVDDSLDDGTINWSVLVGDVTSSDPSYNNIAVDDAVAETTDNDSSSFTVSDISENTTEDGGTATFTVVLTAQPTADVSTGITSSDTSEGTVSPSSLTFTSVNWSTPQTVTVTGVNDDLDDGDIAYSIVTAAASSADSNYNNVNPGDVSVTNTDNDDPSIVVVTTPLATTEDGLTDTFTIVLGSQPSAIVSVGLSSSDTSEATVSPSSLTFTTSNWNTPQTVTVTGVNDDLDDGDIEYTVITAAATSTDPSYNGVNSDDVTGTNEDNDSAGLTVTNLSNNTTESGATGVFSVVLGTQPTDNVTMTVTSSDTSEGTVSKSSLTFTSDNWSTPQSVTVTGVDDVVIDGNINYSILLGTTSSNDATYNNLSPGNVSATNNDNDSASIELSAISRHTTEAGQTATFTMTIASQPSADVSISLTSSDTTEGTVSPSSVTFTSLNWLTPQTITVTGVDDVLVDGTISYTIVTGSGVSADSNYNGLSVPEVSVQNDDNDTGVVEPSTISGNTTEGQGAATFTVVLTSQPSANVIIPLATSDDTEGTVSPSSLTFNSENWSTPQTVTVTGVNDDLDDGDIAYSIVLGTTTSSDAAWNGQNPADVSVTNTDNDAAGITVSGISGSVSEAGGTATFTISLTTAPTSDVVIGLTSSDPSEGTIDLASLTFTAANYSEPQTVTVTGADDSLQDGNQIFTITTAAATSSDPNYNGLNPSDVAVTNLDNDTVGITLTYTNDSNRVTEGGASDTYTVALASEPADDVVITLTGDDQLTVSPEVLTFTAENYAEPQVVTIRGIIDGETEGTHAGAVSYVVTSTDENYDGYNLSNTLVQVYDRRRGSGYVAPVQSSLILTAPTESTLTANRVTAIRWETTGPDFFVNINLSLDAGVTWQPIATNLRNSGEYLWLIPEEMRSPEAYIEVALSDLVAIIKTDRNDAPFAIVAPITDAPSLPGDSPTITPPETWSGPGLPAAWVGMFVKAPNSQTVYLLADDGTRRPFLDQSIFFTYSDSFDSVITMPAIMLDSIPVGRPMLPAFGSLVKETSDPSVYLVTIKESIYRLGSEAEARTLFGWNWAERVIDLPASIFQWFTRLN
jgi:hypothetical protein